MLRVSGYGATATDKIRYYVIQHCYLRGHTRPRHTPTRFERARCLSCLRIRRYMRAYVMPQHAASRRSIADTCDGYAPVYAAIYVRPLR